MCIRPNVAKPFHYPFTIILPLTKAVKYNLILLKLELQKIGTIGNRIGRGSMGRIIVKSDDSGSSSDGTRKNVKCNHIKPL